jgi:GT2 family glycosyltransferase
MLDVIIPNYRNGSHLDRCLESISLSALQAQEVINVFIISNGPEIPEERSLVFASLNINVLRSRPNSLSAARNFGISQTTADWLLFLDDDIWVSETYFSELRRLLVREDLQIVAGRVILQDRDKVPHRFGQLGQTLICNFDLGDEGQFINHPGIGANLLVRRDVFARIGGFREDLGRNGHSLLSNEDVDFCLRAFEFRYKIYYSGSLIAFHENHQDRLSMQWFIERMFWQGISDSVMGVTTSREKLLDALGNLNLLVSGTEFLERISRRPSNAIEFESQLMLIREISHYFSRYSIQKPIEIERENLDLSELHPTSNQISQVTRASSNETTLFVEFMNNHPGNYVYVYSEFLNSSIMRIPYNPWIEPEKTFTFLFEHLNEIPKTIKKIVFLTSDPIFWNQSLSEEVIKRLSQDFILIGYVHRTNKEIILGIRKLHGFFTHLVMYGEAGSKSLSQKSGAKVEFSPVPSFNESHFGISNGSGSGAYVSFGLIGEFRREKTYTQFLKFLSDLTPKEKKSMVVKFFGRDKDGSKRIVIDKITDLGLIVIDLESRMNLNTKLDRHFIQAISSIDVLVSAYDTHQEVSASGPVAEALSLGKRIFLSQNTFLHEDLARFVPNSIYDKNKTVICTDNRYENLEFLVSSKGALEKLERLLRDE